MNTVFHGIAAEDAQGFLVQMLSAIGICSKFPSDTLPRLLQDGADNASTAARSFP